MYEQFIAKDMNNSKTQTLKKDCPITLFIQFKNGNVKRLYGDRFTNNLQKMITNLYRYAKKNRFKTHTMIMYDNRFPNNQSNMVMKWDGEKLEINETRKYGIRDIHEYGTNIR